MNSDSNDYCDLTSQLDAREILRYLNNLGIQNISGEVLKYFITDLKKLIKYDLLHKDQNYSSRTYHSDIIGPERLHSASTFSSRIRSKVQNTEIKCHRECETSRKRTSIQITQSAPTLYQEKSNDKPTRRVCSCVRVDKKPDMPKEIPKSTISSNLIKVPKQLTKKKGDPVSLYHYYTTLWARYKPNVPGENDWSELRWSIRQKMAGNIVPQASNKPIELQDKNIVKKKKASSPASDVQIIT